MHEAHKKAHGGGYEKGIVSINVVASLIRLTPRRQQQQQQSIVSQQLYLLMISST